MLTDERNEMISNGTFALVSPPRILKTAGSATLGGRKGVFGLQETLATCLISSFPRVAFFQTKRV